MEPSKLLRVHEPLLELILSLRAEVLGKVAPKSMIVFLDLPEPNRAGHHDHTDTRECCRLGKAASANGILRNFINPDR